ncbi:unnamed protein product [Notodromas monacha]|uniref:Tetraspanin n=1 Tax=Notodromas monacha TaxID=399045 RepID=A0A7R9BKZ4_9CRUS|nr:unnamed protein product [Notodromas monacha]CAG0917410.1 unnamed protein product [Notodromas monacha]
MGCAGCEVDEEQFKSPPVALMQHSGYCFIRYVFWIFNCLIWIGGCGLLGAGIWMRLAHAGYANLLPHLSLFSVDSLVIAIGGCGLLGAGIWMRLAHAGYANLLPHLSLFSVDSLVIAVGVITFVTAFFGCCGAWFQQQISLIIYFILVILITIVELSTVTALFVYHAEIGNSFQVELMKGIQLHYNRTADFEALVDIWDDIQTEFECCGVRSYEDWFLAASFSDVDQIPASCCRRQVLYTGSCRTVDPLPEEIYSRGCYVRVRDWVLERLHFVGIGGLLLAFCQLFGLVTSILMYCTLRDLALQAAPYSPYKAYESA